MSGRRAKWCHRRALELREQHKEKNLPFMRVYRNVKRLWKQAPGPLRKRLVRRNAA